MKNQDPWASAAVTITLLIVTAYLITHYIPVPLQWKLGIF